MPDQLRIATYIPLFKSVKQADGSLRVVGILSDETVDLEGESIPFDMMQKSYDYMREWGKVNWDHGDETIGEITDVRSITAADAAREFDVRLNGKGTRIETRIYPINDVALAPPALKRAHYLADAGAKLGFSADGVAIRKPGGGFEKMISKGAALCAQPVNPSSVARVVKSLSAALSDDAQTTDGDGPDVIVVQPELEQIKRVRPNPTVFALAKALAAGSGVNPSTMTGGQAIKRESLEGGARDNYLGRNGGPEAAGPGGLCVCPSCGHEEEHDVGEPCDDLACTECGAAMARKTEKSLTTTNRRKRRRRSRPNIERLARNVRKALASLKGRRGVR